MSPIRQELGTGSSENREAEAGYNDNLNMNPSAGHLDMGGLRLPPPGSKRWWPHRKAAVVAAVRGGILSLDDACERYALSIEEYLTWQHGIDLYGLAGLRINGTQRRRRAKPRSPE
jgi:hypothetical protein